MRQIVPVAFGLLALLMTASCWAGGLTVSHAWIRLLPGGLHLPAAGYFDLANTSSRSVELVGATTPAFKRAMLHRSISENGVEKMVHVAAVTVPAHGNIHFAPGGYHIMLMHRSRPLAIGATLPITLRFKDGTTVTASFQVRGATGE